MTKINVYSKALDTNIEVSRIIGHIKGKKKGPTLIFMGGIHGNEPAGVFAMHRIFPQLKELDICGSVYGLTGNMSALVKGERFNNRDLNRLWTRDRMKELPTKHAVGENPDETEQIEINNLIRNILKKEAGPFYFFDMHTTSSETLPFLTVNDSLKREGFT